MTRDESTSETAEQRIGPELKRLREQSGRSVRALADQTGFSASFISQLENGLVSPSIASLEKIASMLGVTLAQLFTDPSGSNVAVVRADKRPSFRSSWSKASIDAVMPLNTVRSLEAMMVTLDPGGTSGKHPSVVALDQLAVIFHGRLTLTLAGERVELDRGDAVLIRARVPHQWENTGSRPGQVLIVSSRHAYIDDTFPNRGTHRQPCASRHGAAGKTGIANCAPGRSPTLVGRNRPITAEACCSQTSRGQICPPPIDSFVAADRQRAFTV